MALYEYYCDSCRLKFEQLTSDRDPDKGKCPKCQGNNTRKLISRFAVGGQGDLRESTMHGCHDCHVPVPDESSGSGCGSGGCGHSHH
ncbi:MAG: zinc ribbon domain-containing protein [Oligoflexia bacterium]|nr:zinc ribbon domain-containing protein [Oligoflexia bacterium]